MSAPVAERPIEFGVQIETAEGQAVVAGTVAGGEYVFTVVDGDETRGPFEGAAVALPLALATLLGLGPRDQPGPDAPTVVVPAAELELEPGRAGLFASAGEEVRAGTPIAGNDWILWSCFAAWHTDDGRPSVDGFTVIDGFEHGLAAVQEADDGVVLIPCTTTDVWIELCSLLPSALERATGLAPDSR